MFDPVCYHSKFVFLDRYRKEKHILDDKPRLLIATQVVEVSLELDYDVMHTECATFDALVHGAGASTVFVVLSWGESWSTRLRREVRRSTANLQVSSKLPGISAAITPRIKGGRTHSIRGAGVRRTHAV